MTETEIVTSMSISAAIEFIGFLQIAAVKNTRELLMRSYFVAAGSVGMMIALVSMNAFAQQKPANAQEAKAEFTQKLNDADINHDGKLSREEAESAMPEVYKNYDKIDTKKTGGISQKQIGAYFAAKAKRQQVARDPGSLN